VNNQTTTIYIVRHGQSEHNLQEGKYKMDKAFWDASQSALTELGIQQAKEVAKKLKSVHFTTAFSSKLLRTMQTLNIIIDGRNIPIEAIDTIYERKQGNEYWKLAKPEREKLEKVFLTLQEDEKLIHKLTPSSESVKEAMERFKAFLEKIIPVYKGKRILVVNHGGLMRFFLMHIGWAKFDELPAGSIQNTGYYVLETDGNTYNVRETYGIDKRLPH
jgi:broad specificity phosphatase PhoE